MAFHIFTFVRGRAGQRWQPLREPHRRQHSRHSSAPPSSSIPPESDPDTHSVPIENEPWGRLNFMEMTRRAFLAEDHEAGMPRGVEPLDPRVGWQTHEETEWVSLRVGSGEGGRWWVVAGVVWFSLWLLALVWVLRH